MITVSELDQQKMFHKTITLARTFTSTLEYLIFALHETLKDDLYALVLKVTIIGHVSTHSSQFGFLDF